MVFKTIARTSEQALTITARRHADCGRFTTFLSRNEAKASGFCFIRIGEPENRPVSVILCSFLYDPGSGLADIFVAVVGPKFLHYLGIGTREFVPASCTDSVKSGVVNNQQASICFHHASPQLRAHRIFAAGGVPIRFRGRLVMVEEGCQLILRPRPGRESHHGIVIDPAQGKLADAPVQRAAIELRLGRIR